MERERVVEIFAGLALIVFLILLVFLVIGVSGYGYSYRSTAASTTIVNSYNTNSLNPYPMRVSQATPSASAYTTRTMYLTSYPSRIRYSSPSYNFYYPKRTYSGPYIVDRSRHKYTDYRDGFRIYYFDDSKYSRYDRYDRYGDRYYGGYGYRDYVRPYSYPY